MIRQWELGILDRRRNWLQDFDGIQEETFQASTSKESRKAMEFKVEEERSQVNMVEREWRVGIEESVKSSWMGF